MTNYIKAEELKDKLIDIDKAQELGLIKVESKKWKMPEFKITEHRDRYELNTDVGEDALNFIEYLSSNVGKLMIAQALEAWAKEHNANEIDWKDDDQKKWGLHYEYDGGFVDVIWGTDYRTSTTYFSSKEIALEALEYFGEDNIKIYLGVE